MLLSFVADGPLIMETFTISHAKGDYMLSSIKLIRLIFLVSIVSLAAAVLLPACGKSDKKPVSQYQKEISCCVPVTTKRAKLMTEAVASYPDDAEAQNPGQGLYRAEPERQGAL
jgi:multisubunit Na+/H+ antiporter MnhC subunit